MGKPVHPATVHFPISFLFLGYALDTLNHVRSSLPNGVSSNLASPNDMTRASYYLLSLGLITAIPAVVTGGRELMVMLNKQGMKDADGTVKPKVKAAFAHAVFNDVVLALSTYIWYHKRSLANQTLQLQGNVESAYAPSKGMVIAGVIATILMLMAANIGGVLTYNFGVGFSTISKPKEVNLRAGRYADDIPLKKEIKQAELAGSQYGNFAAWSSATSVANLHVPAVPTPPPSR
ncbi:hypothetical protein AC578_3215 [Pseudocercospora eumusae]|uniref:DUF2231 domain-containing protein n=1 Tax=Pseudocercospora eumusae TaxID=321146 RepID=A0A139H1Z6_9PEZI|nr:hypothetical protein AC578_3215 [Pseudocercospora eumusae]